MASKRRNKFYQNKKQETMEIDDSSLGSSSSDSSGTCIVGKSTVLGLYRKFSKEVFGEDCQSTPRRKFGKRKPEGRPRFFRGGRVSATSKNSSGSSSLNLFPPCIMEGSIK
ncbi:hypothetical protein AAG570_011474 [Ranatra chinensis]|uniref:Uncharacterized protein n=1 Tax=Ranatra chinensis TaxID=642074 RepID=A0ABD0Z2Y1_9HEMI